MISKISHIVAIHYHFGAGGVTGTIQKTLVELLNDTEIPYFVESITCLSASEPKELSASLTQINVAASTRLSILKNKHFGYLSPPSDLKTVDRIHDDIYSTLKSLTKENTLFWIHNYHLGKNPLLTQCLIDFFTSEHTNQDYHCLFHIHDFPEDGRYDNFEHLATTLDPTKLYPIHPRISYASINTRDAKLLEQNGIPATVIPNIVHYPSILQLPAKQEHRQSLLRIAHTKKGSKLQTRSDPYKLILYPVRAIRRKNVLEAMLITQMVNEISDIPVLLAVTLRGESSQEQAYSELCQKFYSRGIIEGFFGIGHELDSLGNNFDFKSLCRCADLFISSSCKEGFGIGFVHAPEHHKPLLARSLPVRDDIEAIFGNSSYPRYWYQSLQIPITFFDTPELAVLKNCYRKKLKALKHIISKQYYAKISADIDTFVSDPHTQSIDFSLLSLALQTKVLTRINDGQLAAELHTLNKVLIDSTMNLVKATQKPANTALKKDASTDAEDSDRDSILQKSHNAISSSLEKNYGYKMWKEKMATAIKYHSSSKIAEKNNSKKTSKAHPKPSKTHSTLIEDFLSLESLRPLYDEVNQAELAIYFD